MTSSDRPRAPNIDCSFMLQSAKLQVMTDSPASGNAAEHEAIIERLNADQHWLASQGVELSQWGPDPDSGKIRVYLAHVTEAARQLLAERYGSAIVVDTESRQWRFTRSTG